MALKIQKPLRIPELEGSYLSQIWRIAWPSSLSMLLFTVFDLIDIKWVGFLGTDPVAAATLVGNMVAAVWSLMSILFTGALALFARFLGAQDEESLRHSYHETIFLSITISGAIFLVGMIFAPQILSFFQLKPEVYRLAVPYLRIFSVSFLVLFLEIPFWTIWIAKGKTFMLLMVNAAAVGLNIILDPVLIFPRGKMLVGLWGLGVKGAAIASLAAELFTLILLALLTRRQDFPMSRPVLKGFHVTARGCLRILKIGIPSSVALMARPLSTLVLQRFITRFGSAGLAGFGIGLRWMGLNWLVIQGLSNAISSLVGRYLGANDPDRAGAMMLRAFLLGTSIQLGISLLIFLFAPQLIAVMEPSPDTVAAGTGFLRWLAVAMLFASPGDVSRAALNGAGNTNPSMIISTLAQWAIKLPLAWVMANSLGIGLSGIWAATSIAFIIEGLLLIAWYSRGEWKNHKI